MITIHLVTLVTNRYKKPILIYFKGDVEHMASLTGKIIAKEDKKECSIILGGEKSIIQDMLMIFTELPMYDLHIVSINDDDSSGEDNES